LSARDYLEWRGAMFVEHDVDRDPDARARMPRRTTGKRTVPVIVNVRRAQVGQVELSVNILDGVADDLLRARRLPLPSL
jgi:glutaredoxin